MGLLGSYCRYEAAKEQLVPGCFYINLTVAGNRIYIRSIDVGKRNFIVTVEIEKTYRKYSILNKCSGKSII